MYFSKSFGYALRSILYVALHTDQHKRVRVDEIAAKLDIPKYFLSKVMEKIAREGILNSSKGLTGGFSVNHSTHQTSLYTLLNLIDSDPGFNNCVLRLGECNAKYPCPLHYKIKTHKEQLSDLLKSTTIAMLLAPGQQDFIERLKPIPFS